MRHAHLSTRAIAEMENPVDAACACIGHHRRHGEEHTTVRPRWTITETLPARRT